MLSWLFSAVIGTQLQFSPIHYKDYLEFTKKEHYVNDYYIKEDKTSHYSDLIDTSSDSILLVGNELKKVPSVEKRVSKALSLLNQEIAYFPDEEEKDYPQFPVETLHLKKGDCEDKAILLASILMASDVRVGILEFKNHAANIVYIDGVWRYVESNGQFEIGYVPKEYKEDYKNKNFQIYILN